jgi:hypothetical protein
MVPSNMNVTDPRISLISLYNGERKGYYSDHVKRPVKLINQLLQEMHPTE